MPATVPAVLPKQPSSFCNFLAEYHSVLLLVFACITLCFLYTCYHIGTIWRAHAAASETQQLGHTLAHHVAMQPPAQSAAVPASVAATGAPARVGQPPRVAVRRQSPVIEELVDDAVPVVAPVAHSVPNVAPTATTAPVLKPSIAIAAPEELPARREVTDDGIDVAAELAAAAHMLAEATPNAGNIITSAATSAASRRGKAATAMVVHFADVNNTNDGIPLNVGVEEEPYIPASPKNASASVALDAAFSTRVDFNAEPMLDAPSPLTPLAAVPPPVIVFGVAPQPAPVTPATPVVVEQNVVAAEQNVVAAEPPVAPSVVVAAVVAVAEEPSSAGTTTAEAEPSPSVDAAAADESAPNAESTLKRRKRRVRQ